MKSQKYNQGELIELRVRIEKDVFQAFEKMAQNTKIPLENLVVIALKRFRHHHADYENTAPRDLIGPS